jgi:hypothetical protein
MLRYKDLEFIEWYKATFKNEKLPCLKCSDKRIIACSKDIEIKCRKFNNYVNELDHQGRNSGLTKRKVVV